MATKSGGILPVNLPLDKEKPTTTPGSIRRKLRLFRPKDNGTLVRRESKARDYAAEARFDADRSLRWFDVSDCSGGDDGDDSTTSQYVLRSHEDTNEFIRGIAGPLNLVSVAGPARSGKSTLINLLAGCKTKELFPTSPGGDPLTKGTDLGNRVMTVEEFSTIDGGEKVTPEVEGQKVAFVDTEGQGDQGDIYDTVLFTPALLCSRITIFNTTEVGKDKILTSLALLTLVANKIDLGEAQDASGPKFGDLIIVINRYTLGDDEETLRKNILQKEIGFTKAIKRRNEIRDRLFAQFNSISLHILKGNSLKEGVQDKINSGEKKFLVLEDFTDSFIEDFMSFRATFSEKLKAPRVVAGKSLTGQSTADFVPAIVKAVNDGDLLHIPNIWREAENEAINKACIQFRQDFRKECDKLHDDPTVLPTSKCTQTLDDIEQYLLKTVQDSLSYISPRKISDTCNLLSTEAKVWKDVVSVANLHKIKTFAQTELHSLIESLDQRVSEAFPDKLVSPKVAAHRLNQLERSLLDDYESKITEYDGNAFPDDYKQSYIVAFSAAEANTRESISKEWRAWVVRKDNEQLKSLSESLEKLNESTEVDDSLKWDNGASDIKLRNISEYNDSIDVSYRWEQAGTVKENYADKVKNAIDVAKSQFERNKEDVKKSIDQELAKQISTYQNKLYDSLKPKKEPGSFDEITDTSQFRSLFKEYMERKRITYSLLRDYLHEFDTRASTIKKDFKSEYQTSLDNFLDYLDNELKRIVPLLLSDFKLAADSIPISSALLRSELDSKLASYENGTLGKFDDIIKGFRITQQSGKNRVEAAKRDLNASIATFKRSKFILLQAAVRDWNREILNKYANVVLEGVVDYTINTTAKLADAISTAKKSYFADARGEEDEKKEAWAVFEEQEDRLYENIRRCQDLFIIKDIDSATITSDMEKKIIGNIRSDVASLANCLGMSWICGTTPFSIETKSQGKGRSYLLKNEEQPSGYDSKHRTNLRFDNWKAEFSDFVFDKPIIRELQPFEIQYLEGPRQDNDAEVRVTVQKKVTETISNSNTFMSKVEAEYEKTAGIEGVASASVKAAFQASNSFSNTKENEISFDVDFDYPVVCPANRKTTIRCLGYKQLVSVTYTAKVRLIPMVTFTGGFTRWGGKHNENPNFLKGHSRKRVYSDIKNGYTNEFREKAATNADPWSWSECIEKYPYVQTLVDNISRGENYELYIRGKWEGVVGWRHVIQTDISV